MPLTRSLLTLSLLALLLYGSSADAQRSKSKPKASPKAADPEKTVKKGPAPVTQEMTAPYYRIAALGSTPGDSVNTFPYPTAIFQLLDTAHSRIRLRFPGLGMLGIIEDTVLAPSFNIGDTLYGYQPDLPVYLLNFPKTEYLFFVDVISKDGAILDSRPLAYEMNVEKYKTASLNYIHEASTGLDNPTLRRRFQPTLLPFSIETNPGWRSTETLDSNMVYALVFRDPSDPAKLEMSLTMRPALVGRVDSAMWENFKDKARIAFGSHGVAVNSIGDFQVEDPMTQRSIRSGYEFVSKNPNGQMEYVAAFLTPRAILLMLAPLPVDEQQLYYDYYRSIARSLKLQ